MVKCLILLLYGFRFSYISGRMFFALVNCIFPFISVLFPYHRIFFMLGGPFLILEINCVVVQFSLYRMLLESKKCERRRYHAHRQFPSFLIVKAVPYYR